MGEELTTVCITQYWESTCTCIQWDNNNMSISCTNGSLVVVDNNCIINSSSTCSSGFIQCPGTHTQFKILRGGLIELLLRNLSRGVPININIMISKLILYKVHV